MSPASAAAAAAVPPTRWFKRSQAGLFAGKARLTGNTISPSKRHVKRHWLPNVQRKALYSEALGKSISLKVTTYALRQMDRMGGLDNYITGTPALKLASVKGESLRRQIEKANRSAAFAALAAPPQLQ